MTQYESTVIVVYFHFVKKLALLVSLIALVFWNTDLNSDGSTWQYGTFMWMVRLTLGTVASLTKDVKMQFGNTHWKPMGI